MKKIMLKSRIVKIVVAGFLVFSLFQPFMSQTSFSGVKAQEETTVETNSLTTGGSPIVECQSRGFSTVVAKWGWTGSTYQPDGSTNGTAVSGDARTANWTANPAVDGVIRKAGAHSNLFPGGVSGTATSEEHDISHVTFCDNETSTPVLPVTIVAQKIVCQHESSLPNWGARPAGVAIDANTAVNFVQASNGDCSLVPDWNFQWSFDAVNPGDQTGLAGEPWMTFGPTNASGEATTTVTLAGPTEIKVREVFKPDYLPFSGLNITENVSAEMYCDSDVLHYDNYDFVKIAVPGNTYHCVAWNVRPSPAPQCGNGLKEDTEICDEGQLNGEPLHCDASCSGNTLAVCGNQIIETSPYGLEQCDDGNVVNGDGCSSSCQIEPEACHSPLDYVNTAGVLGADKALTLSDAVIFTAKYQTALGSHAGDTNFDSSVDVKTDGVINAADYLCSQPYYANAGPLSCQLDCKNLCVNPLDYNLDYFITLADGVDFTKYYENKTVATSTVGDVQVAKYLADINGNAKVDYGDYVCANSQLSSAIYQCPAQCAPVCGDATVDKRLSEACDDGNNVNGDGCSSLCRVETNRCEAPNKLDYNGDYKLGLADAVIFTGYYQNDDILADANSSGAVDYGDKLCANQYYSGSLLYTCTLACQAYSPVCGDTHKDAGEQCDDGNTKNGDGCSSSCQIETPGGGGPSCGNGVKEGDEVCDEGSVNGQPLHCNSACSGNTLAVCGNTVKESEPFGNEQCDDGNTTNGDGCNHFCQLETPTAPPSGGGGGGGGGGSFTPTISLLITKTVSSSTIDPGGQLTYTVTIKNQGNLIGANVKLTDTLPSGFSYADGGGATKVWTWDTISPQQILTVSYGVNVSAQATFGTYVNQAVVTITNGASAQVSTAVDIVKPTVLGENIEVAPPPVTPKPPVTDKKVKVLGFEKLPNTSADEDTLFLLLGSIVVGAAMFFGHRSALKNT